MTENVFVEKLRKHFIEEGFLAKREIGVGYGIADLVLIPKNKIITNHLVIRKNYHQKFPLLKEEYFKTLSLISDYPRKTSLEVLLKKTHLSKSFLKYDILKNLEVKGYIKAVGSNYYFKINGWVPLASELIAVEAKMKDWKRGLIQANRYKVFANKVYLAVPSSIQHLVDKTLLKKLGIGLMVLDTRTNEKQIVLKARSSKPTNPIKNNFAVEHFWNKKTLREIDFSLF